MTSFETFLETLAPRVDEVLDELLPAADRPPQRLHAALRYSVFAGGKRVRPSLVVMAGEAYGAKRETLLPGAAAMEMIHTFSLVHDDLPALDDDDLRRGRASLHKAYDEALAILAGDALLNLGLLCVARRPAAASLAVRARAMEMVAEAVGTDGMIGGQMADLEAEANWPENPQDALESIHRRKTGALLTASLRLGGVYAEVDESADRLLHQLGDGLGLLFQIGDDILDVVGKAEALGKTAGKDADSRKLTYPGLFGLEESRSRLAAVEEEALDLCAALPDQRALFESLIRYLGDRDH